MRVIVTGANGFIGREALKPLIDRGAEVHCVGRGSVAGNEVHWHKVDLLTQDCRALFRQIEPTHLLHFAWYAEPGVFWNAPENIDWLAVSLRLFQDFAAAGGQRAVFAGSCAEYDWSHPVTDEHETPLNPATLYGETKASLFRTLAKAAPLLGVSFAWGRIFFPYGPQERHERLFGSVMDAIIDRRPVQLSAGTQEREFMHVGDTADAFVALLASDVRGAVNIATGQPVSVRTLVETIAIPNDALELMEFGVRPVQSGEPMRMAANVERLKKEVGFEFQFGLEAGLADALHRRRQSRFQ